MHEAHQFRYAAFPGRAVNHAGLAKTATARATARDFQGQTIVDGPKGNYLGQRVRGGVKIGNDAACNLRARGGVFVKFRHINAGKATGGFQKIRPRPVLRFGLFQQIQQFQSDFLAFSQDHQIHERGQRLGGQDAAPSGRHNGAVGQAGFFFARRPVRPGRGPVFRPAGNARQIKHEQDIGIAQLVGDAETDEIHLGQGRVRFHGAQRRSGLTQHGGGLTAGGEHPLRPPGGPGVDQAVNNFLPQIGHAHFVHVRKGQGHAQARRCRVFVHGAFFNAQIAAGFGQQGEQSLHGFGVQ